MHGCYLGLNQCSLVRVYGEKALAIQVTNVRSENNRGSIRTSVSGVRLNVVGAHAGRRFSSRSIDGRLGKSSEEVISGYTLLK